MSYSNDPVLRKIPALEKLEKLIELHGDTSMCIMPWFVPSDPLQLTEEQLGINDPHIRLFVRTDIKPESSKLGGDYCTLREWSNAPRLDPDCEPGEMVNFARTGQLGQNHEQKSDSISSYFNFINSESKTVFDYYIPIICLTKPKKDIINEYSIRFEYSSYHKKTYASSAGGLIFCQITEKEIIPIKDLTIKPDQRKLIELAHCGIQKGMYSLKHDFGIRGIRFKNVPQLEVYDWFEEVNTHKDKKELQ